MVGIPYFEKIFTTDDMKLAVILLIFGSRLRQCFPLEWQDVYPSVDAYVENLDNPNRPNRSQLRTRIIFNFELVNIPDQFVKDFERGINVSALINFLIADGARDALLAARQHLYDLIALMRDERLDAQWDMIKGYGAGELVTFGKRAPVELREEFLNKL
jgi:hypothetical protein